MAATDQFVIEFPIEGQMVQVTVTLERGDEVFDVHVQHQSIGLLTPRVWSVLPEQIKVRPR